MSNQINIFFHGVIDALSIYRALPILVNNNDALLLVLQTLGANGLLILGSVFLFDRAIVPVINILEVANLDISDSSHYQSLLRLIYQCLWLVPICGLCYACSMSWYQSLADTIRKYHLKNGNNGKEVSLGMKSVEYALYGTLSWIFIFLQVQILTVLIPAICSSLVYIVMKLLSDEKAGSTIAVYLATLLQNGSCFILYSLQYSSYAIGWLLSSLLYGWYAFDPYWISQHLSPEQRFSILEAHVAYFLGFGVPFFLLNKLTSFFVDFGGFLMVFPFCIILGSLAQVWTAQSLRLLGDRLKVKKKSVDKGKSTSKKEEKSDDSKSTAQPDNSQKSKLRKKVD